MTTTELRGSSGGAWRRFVDAAYRPVDGASLAVLRVLFGALLFIGTTRFVLQGWVDVLYAEPSFFFKYWGFEWVKVPGPAGVHAIYLALIALSLLVAVGLLYRLAIALFTLLFTYVQLMDATNYLNHYYLVVLLCGLMALLPMNAMFSLDARLFPRVRRAHVPAWCLWLLRFQVGVVYVGAALAKTGPDWLLHAQPMGIWMGSRTHLPVLGPLLELPWAVLFLSWAGFLYDLTIVGWLSWRRTRAPAYVTVLLFHGLTSVFFHIGMFPLIMIIATTAFFSPSWPRRFSRSAPPASPSFGPARLGGARRLALSAFALYAFVQVAVPLRHFAYPGDVLWGEQGMRYSWKVMVREKKGAITYRVRQRSTGREWLASPHDYLTRRQANEMSGQPDLILQLAHHIARDFERRGLGDVEVRVEAKVSLNGRTPSLLIDPDVDLAKVDDGVAVARWLLPPPGGPPLLPRGHRLVSR